MLRGFRVPERLLCFVGFRFGCFLGVPLERFKGLGWQAPPTPSPLPPPCRLYHKTANRGVIRPVFWNAGLAFIRRSAALI